MKASPRPVRRPADAAAAADEGQLVIRLPDPKVLRLVARSALLAAAILFFPLLRATSLFNTGATAFLTVFPTDVSPVVAAGPKWVNDPFNLPMLIKDLRRQGLISGDGGGHAVFLGDPGGRAGFLKQNRIEPLSENRMPAVGNRSVDFVLSAEGVKNATFGFLDRVLKVGGVAAVRLVSEDSSQSFHLPGNYRIAYIRRFGSTIVAIKKISHDNGDDNDDNGDNGEGSEEAKMGRRLLSVDEENSIMAVIEKAIHANDGESEGIQIGKKISNSIGDNGEVSEGTKASTMGNYHIAYIRRFGSTIVAIKKISYGNGDNDDNGEGSEGAKMGRRLLSVADENSIMADIEKAIQANDGESEGTQIEKKISNGNGDNGEVSEGTKMSTMGNYRIAYIQQTGSTIVAIKKISHGIADKGEGSEGIKMGRRLLSVAEEDSIMAAIGRAIQASAGGLAGIQIGRRLLWVSPGKAKIESLGKGWSLGMVGMAKKKIVQGSGSGCGSVGTQMGRRIKKILLGNGGSSGEVVVVVVVVEGRGIGLVDGVSAGGKGSVVEGVSISIS